MGEGVDWAALRRLEADLLALERTNPTVRKASENYDRTVWRILFRRRINERRQSEGKPPLPVRHDG